MKILSFRMVERMPVGHIVDARGIELDFDLLYTINNSLPNALIYFDTCIDGLYAIRLRTSTEYT